MTRTRPRIAATLVAAALSVAMLIATASASAAAPAPISVASLAHIQSLAEAVDASGTAYVAWVDNVDPTAPVVGYCVLPKAATACSHTGTLTPSANEEFLSGVQVVISGSTISILAGTFETSSPADEPELEWQSTDAGASFGAAASGESVVDAGLDATVINNYALATTAVALPGGDDLGLGFDVAGDAPVFQTFALGSPAACGATCSDPYATLSTGTGIDAIGETTGQFAAQGGSDPGVLGIFDTDTTTGTFACSGSNATGFAYAYGHGDQSSGNDYDTSPGDTDSAWSKAVTKGDCAVQSPAVAGGKSGFGVLEDDLTTNATVYHRFDQAHESFDTKLIKVAKQPESEPSLSQDGKGGVYGTYVSGTGSAAPLELSYSPNGGTNWASAVLQARPTDGFEDPVSAVGTDGQGWAAWFASGKVYALPFVAKDAETPVQVDALAPSRASVSGTRLKLPIACPTACTVAVTIRSARTTVAAGRLKRAAGGTATLKLKLSKAGAALFADHGHKLTATLELKATDAFGSFKTSHSLKIHKR